MTTLLLIAVLVFMAACAVLLAVAHNWLWFWLAVGIAAGILWLYVLEQRWPLRVRLWHARLKLRLVDREMDDTSSEMLQAWHDDPGSDHWSGLNDWLTDLQIERITLRARVEDLIRTLGQSNY
jgi:hypothetical protein